ncbi:MAG: hypothetical protein IJO00_00305 [Clostridia bacterium]|nr:hypothetical protein [Clostridia bacterium]
MNFLSIFTSPTSSLAGILYPMAFGIVLATCIVVFNKQTIGKLVKKLFDERASNEETAKTLAELGFERNKLVKNSLKEGSILRKVVKVAPSDDEGADDRYYIPDECLHRAETLYCPDGSSIITIILALIIVIALCVILLALVPELVQLVKNVGNKFKSL